MGWPARASDFTARVPGHPGDAPLLNELDSARSRRERDRGDRLPEPPTSREGLARVEMFDQVSMAFMVALQRLTPAERAVLLLRDVFEFDYSGDRGAD